MTITVSKLNEQSKNANEDAALYILYEGEVTPVESIAVAKKGALVVIRGKGKPRKNPKRFTTAEDGLIGGLNAMGESDATIAELLDRTELSIKKRRKHLGFS